VTTRSFICPVAFRDVARHIRKTEWHGAGGHRGSKTHRHRSPTDPILKTFKPLARPRVGDIRIPLVASESHDARVEYGFEAFRTPVRAAQATAARLWK